MDDLEKKCAYKIFFSLNDPSILRGNEYSCQKKKKEKKKGGGGGGNLPENI